MFICITALEVQAIWYEGGLYFKAGNRVAGFRVVQWSIGILNDDRASWSGTPAAVQVDWVTDSLGVLVRPVAGNPNMELWPSYTSGSVKGYRRGWWRVGIPFWLINCLLLAFPISRWLWLRRRAQSSPAMPDRYSST